jgi:hypothetical protein
MRGKLKQWKMLQPLLTTDSDSRPALGISTDFRDNASLGTPSSSQVPSALYDDALYDVDVYAVEGRTVADWTSISGIGQCAAIHFRARTGRETGLSPWGSAQWGVDVWSYSTSGDVVMRLNGFNAVFEPGAFF